VPEARTRGVPPRPLQVRRQRAALLRLARQLCRVHRPPAPSRTHHGPGPALRGTPHTRVLHTQAYVFRKTWKNLYYHFMPGKWYWEACITLRKFLIAFCSLMFRANSSYQLAMSWTRLSPSLFRRRAPRRTRRT